MSKKGHLVINLNKKKVTFSGEALKMSDRFVEFFALLAAQTHRKVTALGKPETIVTEDVLALESFKGSTNLGLQIYNFAKVSCKLIKSPNGKTKAAFYLCPDLVSSYEIIGEHLRPSRIPDAKDSADWAALVYGQALLEVGLWQQARQELQHLSGSGSSAVLARVRLVLAESWLLDGNLEEVEKNLEAARDALIEFPEANTSLTLEGLKIRLLWLQNSLQEAENQARSLLGSVLGFQIKLTGWMSYSLSLLLFSMWYSASKVRLWIFGRTALFGLFIVCIGLVWTNQWHQLIQVEPFIVWWTTWGGLGRERWGYLVLPLSIMNNIIQIYALASLAVYSISLSQVQRRPIRWLTVGGVLQNLSATILPSANLDIYFPDLETDGQDWFVLGYSVAVPFLIVATLHHKMYLRPLAAWLKGQTELNEALIVLNPSSQILEMNRTAKQLFALEPNFQDIAKALPDLDLKQPLFEWKRRIFQPKIGLIQEENTVIGKRIVLHDITELELAQRALQERNQELESAKSKLENTQKSLERSNLSLLNANTELRQLQTQLKEQAIRDKLTGLFNRRMLDDTLLEWTRKQTTFSLLLFDIDHFREFNSRYGYVGGDCVLQTIGQYLLENLPSDFIACRYGGEEFCVLIPLEAKTSLEYAKRVQQQLGDLRIDFNGRKLQLTVSSSIASFEQHGNAILLEADAGLRRAKQKGRNQLLWVESNRAIWMRGWV